MDFDGFAWWDPLDWFPGGLATNPIDPTSKVIAIHLHRNSIAKEGCAEGRLPLAEGGWPVFVVAALLDGLDALLQLRDPPAQRRDLLGDGRADADHSGLDAVVDATRQPLPRLAQRLLQRLLVALGHRWTHGAT